MADLTIRHTHADGTLLDGSSKGDGVYDILRGLRCGWRYFPSIGAIGIGRSRDRVAKRSAIRAAQSALEAAGHSVTVDIDDEPRARATVLADQADRLDDRREALTAKAERRADEAQALWDRSDRLVEHIPLGQPILVGHHSERRHRRTLEKSQNAAFAAVAAGAIARETALRAEAVGRDADAARSPRATRERIERLEAELRGIDRQLGGYEHTFPGGYVERHSPVDPASDHGQMLTARAAQLRLQLDHDRATVAAAVDAGALVVWDRTTVHVGDEVSQHGRAVARAVWHTVKRVNAKTVTVPTGYSWDDKIPYTRVRQVRCPHGDTP